MYTFRPMALPNVPDPVNGMIRTYENEKRTFSRPFSAKTVFFYKDGDQHFTGVRLPVSKNRYRTIDSLLDDLNTTLYMPFGVRRLTTPMGRTNIETLDQLQHMGKYVATSSKFPRGINLSALERFAKARQQAHARLSRETEGGQSYWVPTSPSYKAKLRMSRSLGLNFVPSKQVFFVLNGTAKLYRTLLNPIRLPTMENLLKEVSDGLSMAIYRLYTVDGRRIFHVNEILNIEPPKVLAVQRHAKPILREQQRFTLPPIQNAPHQISFRHGGTFTKSSRSVKTNRTNMTSLTTSTSTNNSKDNSIEKPRTSIRKNTRKSTGAPPKKKKIELPIVARRLPPVHNSLASGAMGMLPKIGGKHRQDDSSSDSGKATSAASSRDKAPPIEDDDESSDYPETHHERTLTGESRMTNVELIREEHEERTTAVEEDIIKEDDDDIVARSPKAQEDEDEGHEDHDHDHSDPESEQSSSEEEQPDTEDERHSTRASTRTHSRAVAAVEDPEAVEEENEEETEEHEEEEEARRGEEDAPSDPESEHSSSEEEQPDTEEEEEAHQSSIADEENHAKEEENNNVEEFDDSYEISHTPRPVNPQTPLAPAPSSATSSRAGESPRPSTAVKKELAATTIQAYTRGFLTRKNLKATPSRLDEEAGPSGANQEEEEMRKEVALSPNLSTHSEPLPATTMTYTISVMTGNRWGADSEADLFITIHGEDRKSDRITLGENENATPKFRQQALDSFHVTTPMLGTLKQIVVGHNEKGYGAGIYIEHILVTENVVEGRQFVFYVHKWFDSGQVDGKLIRSFNMNAFYYIGSIPSDDQPTQGRWEFVLHSGMPTGEGATTSNLRMIGFGTSGSSATLVENDISLQKVPSKALVQVDFGHIGELLKVRIEVDGTGLKPDYYLDLVEMRDLDTEERLVVSVDNWLDFTGTKTKKPQSFRELSVFRSGTQTLPITNYEGRVTIGDVSLLSSRNMQAQLVGEYSDSGVFPLIASKDETKGSYGFKVDCVYLGRITTIKVFPDFTDRGREIFDGLSLLQNLWEKRGLPTIPVASELIASSAWVRESQHCPYRYNMTESHVEDYDDDEEDDIRNSLRHCKRLVFTGMKGMSTSVKKPKDEPVVADDDWLLGISIEEDITIAPTVKLVVVTDEYVMEPMVDLDVHERGTMHFQLRHTPIGRIDKVRIEMGLDAHSTELLHIHKMRLVNRTTNEQIRYPKVATRFETGSVVEFPAVYPDCPPRSSVIYTVAMETTTLSSSGPFEPLIQIEGADSNTGYRRPHGVIEWKTGSRYQFDIEAIDIGQLKKVQMRLQEQDASWEGTIMVASSIAETHYTVGDVSVTGSQPLDAVLRPF